jgi:hypothetical protein
MNAHCKHCKQCYNNALVSRSHVGIRFNQGLAHFNSSSPGGNVQRGASPNKTGNQGRILETHAGDGIVGLLIIVYLADISFVMQKQLGYVRLFVTVDGEQ